MFIVLLVFPILNFISKRIITAKYPKPALVKETLAKGDGIF